MKLQKQVAYKYKEKTHYKYVVLVPQDIVYDLGWEAGQELLPKIDGRKLVLEPSENL